MIAALPQGYTLRNPTADDLQSVTDLIIACDLGESGSSDFDMSQLRNYWNEPDFDLASDAWVAIAPSGQIVGYEEAGGDDGERYELDGYVHPEHSNQGIGTCLLRVAEGRVRAHASELELAKQGFMRANINTNNDTAHDLFLTEGYAVARQFWRMEIKFDAPPAAPQWPEGITVRTFVLEQDDRATHAAIEEAFRDHWGHSQISFEDWKQTRLGRENFDPTLWFLALDGDEIAGAALCFPRGEDGGWVQGLGVRRPWRRNGLGRALLLHAFNIFRERGKTWVGLGVDAASLTGATRLYERAGMQIAERYTTYEKAL